MSVFMKRRINLLCSIILIICSPLVFAKDNYPEREVDAKWDEVGSLTGNEGLVFRPGKVKNESTKASGCAVNKYLWQASIKTLSFAPLASVDSNGGVIITEWYSPNAKQNYRFKINIFIKDDVIHPDAIEVKIFEETFKNNRWTPSMQTSNLAFVLEDKILRKARALYINAERK